MKKEASARFEPGELLANSPLAEIMRLRQFAASYGTIVPITNWDGIDEYVTETFKPTLPSNKYDWLLDWLDQRGISRPSDSYGATKIVVASQFTKLLLMMNEALRNAKIETGLVYGRSKSANRADIERFMNPKDNMRVMLINTWSGGTAITLDIANEMVVMDETWIPDDQDQLERRIDRVAGDNKTGCQYWYVRSRGTVEEHIATINTDRRNIQGELLDGRRGVKLARQLVEGH
jgi:SNF2 family DNA or RNA helicase